MFIIYLLTGSNIGNSHHHLEECITHIAAHIGKIVQVSSVYQTEPWGNKQQQDFLNQVLQVETNLTPEAVLQAILSIETQMGRHRETKWEPRIIDIDILFYENQIIQTPSLTVPHPLLHQRRFTLLPLHEIAPDFIHPSLHQSIEQLLAICNDTSVVTKVTGQTGNRSDQ